MEFDNTPGNTLTVPSGAGPGTARIVVTNVIPPIIQAHPPAVGSMRSIIIFYTTDDTSFSFIGLAGDNGEMSFGYASGSTVVYGGAVSPSDSVNWTDIVWQDIDDTSPAYAGWVDSASPFGFTFLNGWDDSPNLGDMSLSLKRLPFNACWIAGRIRTPNPFNATVGTVPSWAVPRFTNQFVPAQRTGASGLGLRLVVGNTGTVTASGDATVSVDWYVNGIYPLDV